MRLTFADDCFKHLVVPVACPGGQVALGGVAWSDLAFPLFVATVDELEVHLAAVVVEAVLLTIIVSKMFVKKQEHRRRRETHTTHTQEQYLLCIYFYVSYYV